MCHSRHGFFKLITIKISVGQQSFVSHQSTTEYDILDNTHSFCKKIFIYKQQNTKTLLRLLATQITNANDNLITSITYNIVPYATYSDNTDTPYYSQCDC